jgi:F420-dependent oxidoreductase-like protein
LSTACVVFETTGTESRARNRARGKSVPQPVLAGQVRRLAEQRELIETEGFDVVLAPAAVRTAPRTVASTTALAAQQVEAPVGLRFGLQLPVYTWPGGAPALRADLREIARAAENAGFSSLWVMDHFRQIPMFGPPWNDMLESWTTLSFLAAVTERVTLGTLVTGITYRNVAHLGKIVATLDVLSGGRAVCGLGAGWFADEHRAYGWELPSLAERYALLEDALELLPVLWGKGTPAYRGRVVEVPEAMCYPRPLQEHLPILVGGNGERRTLRLVAQYADKCNVIGDLATVERKRAVLDAHCKELGRDRDEIEVTQLSTTLVGRDGEELDALLERLRPRRSSAQRYAERVNAGTVGDQIGRFRALADAGVGTAIVSLPDLDGPAAVERFAAVIAAFT